MDGFVRWAWYLNIAAAIALVFRIYLAGLVRMYRFFFAYLLVDILQQVLRLLFQSQRWLDAEIYIGGQAVELVLTVFVVLELYWLALADHPALARFGRKTAGVVLGATALIAASGLMLDSSMPVGRWPVLYRFLSFERTMDAWLLIFLLLITLFMTWFPVRLKRNLALYIGGFVVFFMANAAAKLLINLLPDRFLASLNTAMLSLGLLCLIAWLFALQPADSEETLVIGHRWNPEGMARLSHQLDSINASLVRLSRQ